MFLACRQDTCAHTSCTTASLHLVIRVHIEETQTPLVCSRQVYVSLMDDTKAITANTSFHQGVLEGM